MLRKVLYPVAAVAALGLAFSFNGCSCNADAGMQTAKAPEPPPPPAPPPAPAPAPAPAATQEPPPAAPPHLVSVGKAQLEGDQVKIPGAIEYDVDKATIKATKTNDEILNTLAEFIKQNPSMTKLAIEGYTDNSGKPDHNQTLSQARAESVVKWLTDHGVDKSKLDAHGYGADHPVAANDSAAHKAQNRRTEFHVREINGKQVTAGSDIGGGAGNASANAGGSTGGGDTGAATTTTAGTPAGGTASAAPGGSSKGAPKGAMGGGPKH